MISLQNYIYMLNLDTLSSLATAENVVGDLNLCSVTGLLENSERHLMRLLYLFLRVVREVEEI